jgi:hypothetical protein
LRLALHEHPDGVEVEAGPRVVYDLDRNEAAVGPTRVSGHALVWELGGDDAGAALAAEVELDAERGWVVRCDRIDFPPGGMAYRHVHPGPGIRRQDTASVRVLLLPHEWEGRRTIRYVDPADEAKPKLQRATVLLEQPLSL